MKKNTLFLALIAIITLSCQESKNAIENTKKNSGENNVELPAQISEVLSPKDFLAKFESKEGAQLVDVRTPQEVADGAIEGAANIDYNAPDFKDKIAKLDKEKPVFLYCRSGGRSGNAAKVCKDMGFKEIYDMEGGWLKYSTEK